MRVNWTERLEARGAYADQTPPSPPSACQQRGRGGRQGKHAAHHNAERPPPRAVAKKKKQQKKGGGEAESSRGRAWAAWGREAPWRSGGGGVGWGRGGQREEQTPATRHEFVRWVMANDPSSIIFSLQRRPACAGVIVQKNGTLRHTRSSKWDARTSIQTNKHAT